MTMAPSSLAGDHMGVYDTSTCKYVFPLLTCEYIAVSDISFRVANTGSSLISITLSCFQAIPPFLSSNQGRNNAELNTRNGPIGPRGQGHPACEPEGSTFQEKHGTLSKFRTSYEVSTTFPFLARVGSSTLDLCYVRRDTKMRRVPSSTSISLRM